jgi:hypothetical protein
MAFTLDETGVFFPFFGMAHPTDFLGRFAFYHEKWISSVKRIDG